MGAILKKTRLVLPSHTKQVSWHHFLQQGGAFHKSPNALIIISSIECQKENTGFHLEVFSIHFNCAYILFWYCQSCLQSWKPKSRSREMSFQRGMCVCCGKRGEKENIGRIAVNIYSPTISIIPYLAHNAQTEGRIFREKKWKKSFFVKITMCSFLFRLFCKGWPEVYISVRSRFSFYR